MKVARARAAYRWVGVLALGLAIGVLSAGAALAQSADASSPTVVVGTVRGTIDPVMAAYVERVIGDGESRQAQAVILEMDTPGGLSDSMRDINQRILASQVPVIVYVAPGGARAASAGMYISYAAQLVGMAPTTNIGSATPVSLNDSGGEQQMSPEMQAKVTNDAVAQVRSLAQERGRNGDFAEQAIREGANLQASDALSQNVVNYIAPDLPDLLRQVDGATVSVPGQSVTLHTANAAIATDDMSGIETMMFTLTDPTIAYILLSLGSLGLLLELYNPGSIFPGVIGGICLMIALYALGTLPLNLAALGLLVFGLALFGLEPYLSAHGTLAVGGALSFVLGSALLINAPESAAFLRVSPVAITGVTLFLVTASAAGVALAIRTRRRPPVTGREGLVGAFGRTLSAIPAGSYGYVRVEGERWRAVALGHADVAPDSLVLISAINGLELTVQPVAEPKPIRAGTQVAGAGRTSVSAV